MSRRTLLAALLCAQAACTSSSFRHPAPGAPAPLAWIDTLPIEEPAEADSDGASRRMREMLVRQPGHELSLARAISGTGPALNVDAFDEVTASSWFRHRVTTGRYGPDEVAAGPPLSGPDMSRPLRVVAGKVEGVTSGLTVEDTRGIRFLVKFDPPGMSGLGSGADVVSSRIFWAAGYNTPKDVVIHFRPSHLVVAEDAEIDGDDGPRPMTRADVDAVLSETDRGADGSIRALASRFIEGTPKGPFRFRGTRPDDPNDRYPHEDRRELRGLWVLASWLNHVDLRVENTLDSFIEPGGYLRHYLIDFATTLGSGAIRPLNAREGEEFAFDAVASLGRLLTLGAYRVGWEGVDDRPLHPALGWLSADFDPGSWEPFIPNEAFRRVTDRDGYWGAKLVAAFDDPHVGAVIEQAEYPPEAARILHDILVERRRRVLTHWFARVTPVEEVVAESKGPTLEISFRDLAIDHGLSSAEETEYAWSFAEGPAGVARVRDSAVSDPAGVASAPDGVTDNPAAVAGGAEAARDDGGPAYDRHSFELEVGGDLRRLLASATPDDPVVLELRAVRADVRARAAHIRLATDASGAVRVVGLLH